MKSIDKKISINKSTKDERVVPNTDQLFVKEVKEENGRKMLEKTYKFKGTADNMKLMFKTLSHRTTINKPIKIYKEK
ncbi:hypothetical protein [Clostridium estertheticum]|uniref:hypothetical protein n=1 Tax=Clostridium estertheticum TaxID=238834 RepID=UPI001CF25A24|nr:hypothetical protein [Clostridium estertheticum]MCB2360939.1 hypothetical protein [Clostridium estertheticum]